MRSFSEFPVKEEYQGLVNGDLDFVQGLDPNVPIPHAYVYDVTNTCRCYPIWYLAFYPMNSQRLACYNWLLENGSIPDDLGVCLTLGRNIEQVLELVEMRPSVLDFVDSDTGLSVFALAGRFGIMELVCLCIGYGLDATEALLEAEVAGHREIVEWIKESGYYGSFNDAFVQALMNGDRMRIDACVRLGVQLTPDEATKFGVHNMFRFKKPVRSIIWLIAMGASVEQLMDGWCHSYCDRRFDCVFKLLCQNGANLNRRVDNLREVHTLVSFVFFHRQDLFEYLVGLGVDLDADLDQFGNLLHRVVFRAMHNHTDVANVQKILDAGANVNAMSQRGTTPLQKACRLVKTARQDSPNHWKVIKMLLTSGADAYRLTGDQESVANLLNGKPEMWRKIEEHCQLTTMARLCLQKIPTRARRIVYQFLAYL